MRAAPGDRIVLAASQVGHPTRDGEVIEVRGADGSPPYLVRWSDGAEGLLFPGPGSVLHSTGQAPRHRPAVPASPVREWQIRVSVFEQGDDTTAQVALVSETLGDVAASGVSHRGR